MMREIIMVIMIMIGFLLDRPIVITIIIIIDIITIIIIFSLQLMLQIAPPCGITDYAQ